MLLSVNQPVYGSYLKKGIHISLCNVLNNFVRGKEFDLKLKIKMNALMLNTYI